MFRHQGVVAHREISKVKGISYGIPQRSVLGSASFALFMSALAATVTSHSYADDSDLATNIQNIESCVDDVRLWMETNYLKISQEKTQLLFSLCFQDSSGSESACWSISC